MTCPLTCPLGGISRSWVRERCRSTAEESTAEESTGAWRRLPVGACARASRLARSLAFPRCVYAVARRAASPFPLCTGRGPAAGVLREWCLVASRACRAVATGTVLCHGAALCAQRSALSAMINLSAPPMRKRGVARDRCRCEGLGRRTGAVGGADRGMGYGLRRDLTRVCGARAALETEIGKIKNCRDHGVRIVEGGS